MSDLEGQRNHSVEEEEEEEENSQHEDDAEGNAGMSSVAEENVEPTPGHRRMNCRRPSSTTSGKTNVPYNSMNKFFGPLASEMATEMGKIARNCDIIPLRFHDWRMVDPSHKKDALRYLRKKYDFPRRLEKEVLQKFGKCWRDYKSDIKKKNFFPLSEMPIAEILRNKPRKISEQDWNFLVDFWKSEKAKIVASKNKENAEKQKYHHTLGRKSIATLVEEMKEENQGSMPTRPQIWIKSRQGKDDAETVDAIARVRALETATPQDSDASTSIVRANDSLAQQLGPDHPTQVRDLDIGATSSRAYTSDGLSDSVTTNEELRAQNQLLREQLVALTQDLNNMKNEINEIPSRVKQLVRELYHKGEMEGPPTQATPLDNRISSKGSNDQTLPGSPFAQSKERARKMVLGTAADRICPSSSTTQRHVTPAGTSQPPKKKKIPRQISMSKFKRAMKGKDIQK